MVNTAGYPAFASQSHSSQSCVSEFILSEAKEKHETEVCLFQTMGNAQICSVDFSGDDEMSVDEEEYSREEMEITLEKEFMRGAAEVEECRV